MSCTTTYKRAVTWKEREMDRNAIDPSGRFSLGNSGIQELVYSVK